MQVLQNMTLKSVKVTSMYKVIVQQRHPLVKLKRTAEHQLTNKMFVLLLPFVIILE
jgi:hypothetical protein